MLSDLAFVCLHHPHPFPPTPPSHTKASFTTTSATVCRCWENNHLQHPDWWQVYDQGHCHHCWIWHQDTTKGCKWPTLKKGCCSHSNGCLGHLASCWKSRISVTKIEESWKWCVCRRLSLSLELQRFQEWWQWQFMTCTHILINTQREIIL